jgi:AcrR family transcriptional regulator
VGERWDARREQIFSVGARLFAEKGYERTSLQEVADLLGVTKPALYYYFSSKEQLLFEIMSFVMDRVLADISEVAGSDLPPYEKLREFVRRYVGFFAAHPDEHTIMSTEVDSLGPELRGIVLDRQRLYLTQVRRIVSELVAPEKKLDETSVAFALIGGMNWLFKWYDPDGRITPEKLVEDFVRIYAYGLLGNGR